MCLGNEDGQSLTLPCLRGSSMAEFQTPETLGLGVSVDTDVT